MIYTTNSDYSLYTDFAELNGNVYKVNGLTRNLAQDSIGSRNMSIRMTGGAMHNTTHAATGSLTLLATYGFIYTYYNSNKNVESDPYTTALSYTLTGGDNQIGFDIPADATMDTQVTHVRVYRTNANGAIYYYDQQAAYTNAEITISSTIADTSLGSAFGELSFNGISQTYTNGVAPTCPYIETFANRIWLAGNKVYSTGTIAVTQATKAVVGTGTSWTEAMIGMNFRVLADSKVYTIDTVTDTTHLTITENYLAATRTTSTYNIYQYGSILFYSYVDEDGNAHAESFPGADYIPVNEGDGDIGIITGLGVVNNRLFVTKRNSYFTVSGDSPSNFVLLQPSKYIGCCAHRTIANDDMGNVIFLTDRGIYMSDGGKPVYISKNIESIFTNADGAPWTVNRNVLTASHAVYDAFFRRYWLWIASSDSSVPNKVLICDFNLNSEDGMPEWFVADITANCSGIVKDDTGLPYINFGTTGGYIYKIDATATNDGAGTNGAETRRGTCTASGNSTLTDGLATFNTTDDGLAGCKIYIVSGTNAGEYKIISSNTATVITITDTWTTNPDTTSVYAIGAINAYWKSKVFTWENFKLKIINWMKIVFKTQSSSYNLSVNRYEEESSTISETQAVSMSDNYSKNFFAVNKAKRHQIEFKIYDTDRPFMITDVELNVDERNDR